MQKRFKKPEIKSEVLEDIYDYDNYRFLLKDYFDEQKQIKQFLSHRFFASRAGFTSPTTCTYAIDGRRNLSEKTVQQFVKGLGLKGEKAKFFESLVNYNQAKVAEDKDLFYNKLTRIRKKITAQSLDVGAIGYFDKWYHQVVRELVVISDWKGDYYKLAKLVNPAITETQARESVELLTEAGLVEVDEKGKFIHSSSHLNSAQLPMYVKREVRRDFLRFGVEAADYVSPDQRHVSFTTLSMSKKTYDKVSQMCEKFSQDIISMVDEDMSPENVYEMVMQVYPVSRVR